MRLFRFTTLARLALAILAAPLRLYEFGLAFLASAFALFRPGPQFSAAEYRSAFILAAEPLDLALQHSLRHEAGVPRYSAARNT